MSPSVNVIAMAGNGQRFLDAGFTVPKPLVPIDRKPMFVRAASALPPADRWIFIYRDDMLSANILDPILSDHFTAAETIALSQRTNGQAQTCLLAIAGVPDNTRVTFGACDSTFSLPADFDAEMMDADLIVFITKPTQHMIDDPRAFGWVHNSPSGTVSRITCKEPASASVADDAVIVGAFTFANAGLFRRAAQVMIQTDRKARNEFYMDVVAAVCLEQGLNVKTVSVSNFVSWGTPAELAAWETTRRDGGA